MPRMKQLTVDEMKGKLATYEAMGGDFARMAGELADSVEDYGNIQKTADDLRETLNKGFARLVKAEAALNGLKPTE